MACPIILIPNDNLSLPASSGDQAFTSEVPPGDDVSVSGLASSESSRGTSVGSHPAARSPWPPFVEKLQTEIAAFDVAWSRFDQERLTIDMPYYLQSDAKLPEALRNKELSVRLDYDGKVLAFSALVAEDGEQPADPQIVAKPGQPSEFTLATTPSLSAAVARSVVDWFFRYSSAHTVSINSR